jgi:hypothetical protein
MLASNEERLVGGVRIIVLLHKEVNDSSSTLQAQQLHSKQGAVPVAPLT